jgi:TolB protein
LNNLAKRLKFHLTDNQTAVLVLAVILLVLTNLVVVVLLFYPKQQSPSSPASVPGNQPAAVGKISTPQSTSTPTPQVALNPSTVSMLEKSSIGQGTIFFSMVEEGYSHLFAFSPGQATMLRLTNHDWDDITPAVDASGKKLAFSSQKNGYFDIYVMDLDSGQLTQVTDTPEYDSSPTWSPDGSKLVFQSYIDGNFELQMADLSRQPVSITRMTRNKFDDYDPNWSSSGDQLIFVSAFDNTPALWLAKFTDAQTSISPIDVTAGEQPRHPTWSPDGTKLSWSQMVDNRRTLVTWTWLDTSSQPALVTEGDEPAWSADGGTIFHVLDQPNQSYLSANRLPYGNLVYPVTPTSGKINGLVWSKSALTTGTPGWLATYQNTQIPPLYALAITPPVDNLPNRFQLVPLPSVTAPYPMLHDLTNESFQALRERLKVETGWDVFANLENAFIPISEVANPDLQENWLYTGRAFALNTIPLNINWMFISRETYGNQTYFRVFVRPLYQDGSMGKPILERKWDINARFNTDPAAYEKGGVEEDAFPDGYWVDVTDMALRFGWERVQASPNWTNYYEGARFNLFVLRSNLSWKDAMLQLYPVEIFITPTPLAPPTITPTPTVRLLRTKTPSITPTPTNTATHRPTWTPQPEQ